MCDLDGIILASGFSRRAGRNKLLLELDHTQQLTILDVLLKNIPYSKFRNVFLVYAVNRVAAIGEKYPVQVVQNRQPEIGKSRAIKEGLRYSRAADGVMFFVADQPLLTGKSISYLIKTFLENKEKIIVPSVSNKNCNPVIFPTRFIKELTQLSEDNGGREIIRNNPDSVFSLSFEDSMEFLDVDTMDDFKMVKQYYLDRNSDG